MEFFNTFQLSKETKIDIYNLKGERVTVTLSDSSMMNSIEGSDLEYSITWNGTNGSGKPVPSGIYFYKLKIKTRELVIEMFLMKLIA